VPVTYGATQGSLPELQYPRDLEFWKALGRMPEPPELGSRKFWDPAVQPGRVGQLHPKLVPELQYPRDLEFWN
jgi:hypothetical protein